MTNAELDALPEANAVLQVTDPETGVTTMHRQPGQLLFRKKDDPFLVWDSAGTCWEVGRNVDGVMMKQRGPSFLRRGAA